MSKINILPAQVYNRIAAGEVVDRPYSVVKELVENAIDAGSTEIEIYVEQGGKQLIRVVDNGSGIARDDLHAAFLPHATSKISQAEDLENVMTLGFRGEAVASIAAVSKMTITSKTEDGECYSLFSDGGKIGDIKQATGDKGTDVKVEMLFFNTPVRLGFLKSDRAEETDITTFVSRFILSRPHISFRYYVNGKLTLQSFGGGEEEAIVGVYGASILQNTFQIDAKKHGIHIRGYIGNQNFSKPNKSYQCIFLNGRHIVNSTLSSAISNAYSSYLMKRQYPFYVLYITVPTEIVDVNVHPNKADVRFADNQIIYGCVYSVISAVLDGHTKALDYIVNARKDEPQEAEEPKKEQQAFFSYEDARRELEKSAPVFTAQKAERKPLNSEVPFAEVEEPKQVKAQSAGYILTEDVPDIEVPLVTESQAAKKNRSRKGAEDLAKKFPDLYFEKSVLEVNTSAAPVVKEQKPAVVDIFAENKKYLEELEKKAKQDKIDVSSYRYAGKLFNTYLMYEYGDSVYVIDQHAAHERLIFNRLKENMQNRTVIQQTMLLPYSLELNSFESAFIRENLDNIRQMGFDIEDFGGNTYKISAIPIDLQTIDLKAFFNDILGEIHSYRGIKLEEILKDKLASAACKAAVKGGMDLTEGEIEELFKLMDGNMGLKCPHGRPVVVRLTKTELEKMFKRIV